uniref:Uncharacterized protein n=1 Tax=Candidatus Kentrum sp. DK TaxID=2126562 RepID=A0A450SP13_9GAMM|nr:MAG: hypothetical protein BECKDK2373B_GA0170837_105318 [Candidatus Kentron sp. DK]VFJ59680.1 MAG: hypothetical protein BECKDK2373C_GA0170839_10733 [Candidatus Kentron sp. DK]
MQVKTILNRVYKDLYAKLTLHSLTALKMASKCSATKYKTRFLDHFCFVMKHDPCFCMRLYRKRLFGLMNQRFDR